MTTIEHSAALALLNCSFLPGTFDKRWVNQLPNWYGRKMTKKGRETMERLVHKYRRQIPDHVKILNDLKKPEPHEPRASSTPAAAVD